METKIYSVAVAESLNYSDRDVFASDFSLSSIWGDRQDADADLSARSEWCGQLWDATHRTFKDIARESGLSQRALAQRFCIPLRTAEDWGRGASSCPIYMRLLLQEALGLLTVKEVEMLHIRKNDLYDCCYEWYVGDDDRTYYTTNNQGEGVFIIDLKANERRQLVGTYDFSLVGIKDPRAKIRRWMKKQ